MKLFNKLFILIFLLILSQSLTAQLTFDPKEYRNRRTNVMDQMGSGIAVMQGSQMGTAYYPYFQTNDFLYLTGVAIPSSLLIIDADSRETHLFFTISDRAARNEGIPQELVRHPQRVTGIEHIHPLKDFEDILKRLGSRSDIVYTMFRAEEGMRECSTEKSGLIRRNRSANPWDNRQTREEVFIGFIEKIFPDKEIKDCTQFIWGLRVIKSPAEIALMKKAGRIAVKAHREMIRTTRVGMNESELAGLFRYYLKKEGAQDLAYETIVCSGENHPYLHYYKHDRTLQDGDFLVVDGGPDYKYYDIDITVSFPANGIFTERQRAIYTIANIMHEACMQVYRPGLTREQAMDEINAIMVEKGVDLNHPIFKQRGMKYPFGHYVGLAVHDAGGSPQVLKSGMVIANEPFAVFAEENLGVRVEDTILITKTGCENLTPGLPRTVEEIEEFMTGTGVVQVLKNAGIY